jgi:hypothetical protein
VLMAVAVVVTANHYVIDGLVGAVVAVSGLLAAHRLRRTSRRTSAARGDRAVAAAPEPTDELPVVEDEAVDAP